MTSTKVPQYHELMWPALTALKELGGSATVKEMYKKVVEDEAFRNLSSSLRQIVKKSSVQPRLVVVC
jgi:hypothetical protein